MKIEIGSGLELSVQRLVETRLLIQSNSGGGKSWALRRILEQTHGHVQQIVIDVEDEFYTLREKFDYILVRRDGGDCVPEVHSAPLLARRLLELGVSAIVSIYEMKAWERTQFVKLFLDAMVNAPKTLWHPALVIVDEAHIFAPEHGKAESLGSVIDLMTRGRKRGFCGILATQRLSKLHKDAAAEANNKLIGRTGLDVDRKRASEELGFTTHPQSLALRTLKPGNFFAFGPAISDAVTEITVGGVETTHPKAGAGVTPVAPPKHKVVSILSKLADLPKEARDEQATLETMKRDLQAARAELTRLQNSQQGISKVELDSIERHHTQLTNQAREAFKREREELRKLANNHNHLLVQFRRIAGEIVGYCDKHAPLSNIPTLIDNPSARDIGERVTPYPNAHNAQTVPHVRGAREETVRDIAPVSAVNRAVPVSRADGLKAMPRAVLTALAQHPNGLTKAQILILADYSANGNTASVFAQFTRDHWMEESSGVWKITRAGLDALGDFTPLPTGSELRLHRIQNASQMEAKILSVLFDAYPEAVPKHEILKRADYSANGNTASVFAKFVRLNWATQAGKGMLRAADEFFQ